MKGLSSHIESALNTIIDGLDYEIKIDQVINDFEDLPNYKDYNALITTKSGLKNKGSLKNVGKGFLTLNTYIKKDKKRIIKEKKIYFKNIVEVRVFESESDLLEADKMTKIIESKTSSFSEAKRILNKWYSSYNAPSKDKLREYVSRLQSSGEKALDFLKKALEHDIDYDELDPTKFTNAIKAKNIILNGIFDLDSGLIELKNQLESDEFNFSSRDFKLGYPERFARGDFYPRSRYYLNWYNEKEDAVDISPFSSRGEIIILDDLKIQLPKVPEDKTKILFHNNKKQDQYWRRLEYPDNITPESQESFEDFILEEFRRRREGVWFYNNGEPVYLTGNHYFALQWCKMIDGEGDGYMDFRYAQLNMFYHLEACIIDKRCLGQLFVKSRRTGFTYAVLSILLNFCTSTRNNNFGMTSKSDNDASKAFLKFRYMLLNLPFYLKPVIKGKEDSSKFFEFAQPSKNTLEAKKARSTYSDDYLNNMIDFEATKNDAYDGQKLFMYLGDESGKWPPRVDYLSHFGQISPTMLEGGRVVGKAFIGSTVGAMNKGGMQFEQMYKDADVSKRNEVTNMTTNGLYRYFLPAQDNMVAYTDKYGKCWLEKPEEVIYNVYGDPITKGSLDFLFSQEEAKRAENDTILNEQFRAFPRTIDHAFRDESGNTVFNITKIYEQLDYNNKSPEESRYMIGDFEYKNGVKDTDVIFHQNLKGRFKVSWIPSALDQTEHLQNAVKEINGKFYPENSDLIRFGCDPFSLKSTHGKGSKGGLHGKTMFLTYGGVPSNEFVVEYIARPSDERIFFEDVIKCIRFYGAPILVESNRIDLLRFMRNRGYRGFAMDRLDKPKNKLNPNELEYGGQTMSGKDIIDSHMNTLGAWIQAYVGVSSNEEIRKVGEMGKMPFNETLRDWAKFDPDNRTEHDATISSGLAVMACQSDKYRGKKKKKNSTKGRQLIKIYSNKGNIGQQIPVKYKV